MPAAPVFPNLSRPIRMVLFDYGNVIEWVDHKRFLSQLLGDDDPDRIDLFWPRIYGPDGPSERLEKGRLSEKAFQAEVQGILGLRFPHEFFRSAFCRIFRPIPETAALIRSLHGHVRLGLLSNTNGIHFERIIKRHEVFSRFDQVTVSHEIGEMKPDRRIFADVLRQFDGSPREILYLDDIAAYVKAASDLGFQAVRVTDPAAVASWVKAELLAPESNPHPYVRATPERSHNPE